MSGFAITRGKGFHVQFANGVTVSVQFGPHNYCDNNPLRGVAKVKENGLDQECANAETAVFKDKTWLQPPWDQSDVQCDQTPEDVLRLLVWAAEQKA